jgi:hypothetical protein
MAGLHQGLSVLHLSVAQGAAGSTDLVAAPTGKNERVFLKSIVLMVSAAGTLKFTEGTSPTDISGAMDIEIRSGFVVMGSTDDPVLWTPTAKAKLSIVTTGGAAKGWVQYFISDQTP